MDGMEFRHLEFIMDSGLHAWSVSRKGRVATEMGLTSFKYFPDPFLPVGDNKTLIEVGMGLRLSVIFHDSLG